jgi:hypothetical protein
MPAVLVYLNIVLFEADPHPSSGQDPTHFPGSLAKAKSLKCDSQSARDG